MTQDDRSHNRRPGRLSAAEGAAAAEQMAALAEAGLPLAPGLRAAGEELAGSRLAAVFTRLAHDLERGLPLAEAMAAQGRSFPAHLRPLLLGGVQSGHAARLLAQVVASERHAIERRQRLWTSLAYPMLLLVVVFFLMGFLIQGVIPQVAQEMIAARHILSGGPSASSPSAALEGTTALHFLFWMMAAVASGALLLWTASRLGGLRLWTQVVQALPLLGPVVRLERMVRFTRRMEVLLEEETPLPEALRLVAASVPDRELASGCVQAAAQVEAGHPLAESLGRLRHFAPTLLPFVQWSETSQKPAEAFRAAAEAFEERLDLQIELAERIVPPTIFLLVAGTFLVLFFTLASPIAAVAMVLGALNGRSGPGPGSLVFLFFVTVSDPGMLLSGLGPVVLGLAVLAALRMFSEARGPALRDATQQALYVIGWVFVTVGSLATVTMLFGPIAAVVAIVIAIRATFRRRRAQQRALLALLASTAERLLPLTVALEAFAQEYRGSMGLRASRAAARLRAGHPLPAALAEVPGLVPAGTLPLLRLGYESGALGEALREALRASSVEEPILRGLRSRSSYLLCVLMVVGIAIPFLLLKIAPQMQKICADCGAPLDGIAAPTLGQGYFVGLGLLPMIPLLTGVVLFTLVPRFGARGLRGAGLAVLVRRLDRASLLEALSLVAERGYPMPVALRGLADSVPGWSLRRRLKVVAAEVEAGHSLTESLRDHGLLGVADAALLQAAARLGNLAWAMRELADSHRRRWSYRAEMAVQALYPLAILAVGGVVGLYVIGCFLPLVNILRAAVP